MFLLNFICGRGKFSSPYVSSMSPISDPVPLQGPVSFKDMAVDFTQEEWQQLDPDEKTTYKGSDAGELQPPCFHG